MYGTHLHGPKCGHFCLLVELGPICNSVILWQTRCDLRVVSTTAYFKTIMEVYGKHLHVWTFMYLYEFFKRYNAFLNSGTPYSEIK